MSAFPESRRGMRSFWGRDAPLRRDTTMRADTRKLPPEPVSPETSRDGVHARAPERRRPGWGRVVGWHVGDDGEIHEGLADWHADALAMVQGTEGRDRR